MVPWWQRLVYGLVGWVMATCVAGFVYVSSFLVTQHFGRPTISAVYGIFYFWLMFLITALSLGTLGWLLGIPFVLLVKNTRGWRFGVYLLLGSGVGPASLVLSGLHFGTSTDDYYTDGMASAVSGLASLAYLLMLRRAQLPRKSIPESSPAGAP